MCIVKNAVKVICSCWRIYDTYLLHALNQFVALCFCCTPILRCFSVSCCHVTVCAHVLPSNLCFMTYSSAAGICLFVYSRRAGVCIGLCSRPGHAHSVCIAFVVMAGYCILDVTFFWGVCCCIRLSLPVQCLSSAANAGQRLEFLEE